ncbi:unnamed protein product [Macrosiphum euphorbiae]|uniref:Uncharacterized protein n=1 Tax=Macrosiphum euphorbiae TaxID=13131 RepID=A0AAV0WII5_9HEMI|nr:unnamed protein product [Macrosiphum euphorbiae]
MYRRIFKNGAYEESERRRRSSTFYLPLHPVIKLSSLITELRVVFDASAKSTSNLSLNDLLLCGPIVQDDLVTILMQFHKYQFVIKADVEKIFLDLEGNLKFPGVPPSYLDDRAIFHC